MRKLRSQMLGVDQGSVVLFSDFADDGVMWSGTGPREKRVPVVFDGVFLGDPVVTVSISMWDTDQKTNQRADISAADLTPTGFAIVFKTWGDTRIARIRANWLAVCELLDEDVWDVS